MTPGIFVGKLQGHINDLMNAYEGLKSFYEAHVDLGATYTQQYFTDNPDLPFNYTDFTTTLYNIAESTPSVLSVVETGAGYYNKLRTR